MLQDLNPDRLYVGQLRLNLTELAQIMIFCIFGFTWKSYQTFRRVYIKSCLRGTLLFLHIKVSVQSFWSTTAYVKLTRPV